MADVRREEEEQGDGVHGSLADALRCRRPKITVISAEAVDANSWFSASSVLFPSSHPASWSAGIQVHAQPPPSYEQVIKEKTQEDHIVRPTAAPRCSSRTSSKNTQAGPARRKQSDSQKPPKPPRPSLPTPVVKERTGKAGPWDSERADEWTRSVTVHWDGPAEATHLRPTPVPLPRTKSRKHTEATDQTLVQLGEVDNEVVSGADAESSGRYLKELLEVFSEENPDAPSLEEPAHGEMNRNHSQGSIQAQIQVFESQTGPEDGNLAESTKPQPLPRKTTKPPVSSKPSTPVRSQFDHKSDEDSHDVANEPLNPLAGPKPMPPQKRLAGKPEHAELETLLAKGGPPHQSRPAVLTRAYSIHGEERTLPFPVRAPVAPVKPLKEPLKANLNINNHNSTSILDRHYVDSPSDPTPVKRHGGEPSCRPGVTRRPTTIRVPGQTESLQGSPPPLPAQNPVGSLSSTSLPKQKSIPVQGSLAHKPTPSLPHGVQSIPKAHPPPAKPRPGRPPPPGIQLPETPLKPPRRTPNLPPRPIPGHRLYNKYVLPLPHAITTSQVNTGQLSFQKNQVVLLLDEINQDTFECQVGDAKGRVHKSHLRVVTPLGPDSDVTPSQDAATNGRPGNVLKVQVLHDFTPEGPGELAVKAGDIISTVERVDSDWYRGTFQGSTGFFPVNFVKVLSETARCVPEKKVKASCVKVSGPRCVARFDFEGANSNELTFSEGDVIQLKTYVGQEWAQGQMGVHTGIFPLNFVEVIEDLPPPTTQRDGIALPCETWAPAEWVVALYAFDAKTPEELSFKQGDRILVREHFDAEWSRGTLDGREGIFPKAFVQTHAGPNMLGQHSEGSGGVKGRAMYDFTSDCDEELSMKAGDVISKLETFDDEWFLGDLRGKRALVPKNYVQVM
ncbi:SH3 domain-containing protein 19 isoform X2 [Dunckerocampus dactyliophorus]|uniref:SH3 domain-containing protein 19 isoform X2 n=1 Tax=Dunckerocampus dactyliophorus TaxID=161453 RepID=UPI0024051664|nr:SH3 domain-containing protein 19 isoform X2 [Dunckerocampus dactyliophorus]